MPILRYWDATSNQYQPCATGPPGPTGAAGANGAPGAVGPQGPAWPLYLRNVSGPSYSYSGSTYALVDATNAKVTFTAPANGLAILELGCEFNNSTLGVMVSAAWSNVPTSNAGLVIGASSSGNIDHAAWKVMRWLSNSTPGSPITYYLQWVPTQVAGTITIQGNVLTVAAYPAVYG